jgi:Tol biopolymer transport system component
LTGGNCNSSSPAWTLDSSSILFASDCGRAFGLPALYRAPVP